MRMILKNGSHFLANFSLVVSSNPFFFQIHTQQAMSSNSFNELCTLRFYRWHWTRSHFCVARGWPESLVTKDITRTGRGGQSDRRERSGLWLRLRFAGTRYSTREATHRVNLDGGDYEVLLPFAICCHYEARDQDERPFQHSTFNAERNNFTWIAIQRILSRIKLILTATLQSWDQHGEETFITSIKHKLRQFI